jgi:hypothetical protein
MKGFFDVPKKTVGFLTYHGFLTIASSSRIISLDRLDKSAVREHFLQNVLERFSWRHQDEIPGPRKNKP